MVVSLTIELIGTTLSLRARKLKCVVQQKRKTHLTMWPLNFLVSSIQRSCDLFQVLKRVATKSLNFWDDLKKRPLTRNGSQCCTQSHACASLIQPASNVSIKSGPACLRITWDLRRDPQVWSLTSLWRWAPLGKAFPIPAKLEEDLC